LITDYSSQIDQYSTKKTPPLKNTYCC